MSFFKRNLFLHINKFQWKILFCLTALGFSCMTLILLFLTYLNADVNNFFHHRQFFTIKFCILMALPVTALLLLVASLYLYYLTNKMFGPYDRIVQEIDNIVASGQKKEIVLRKGDEMFEQLIERLNKLIQRLS